MSDCKHSHIIYCPGCNGNHCADCGELLPTAFQICDACVQKIKKEAEEIANGA